MVGSEGKPKYVDLEVEVVTRKTHIERLLERDPELGPSKRMVATAIAFLAIAMSLFHLYTSGFGTLSSWLHRSVHLSFVLILAFLLRPVGRGKWRWLLNGIPLALAVATALYMYLQYPGTELRLGMPNQADAVFGTLLILLVLEATRRVCGLPIALLATIFLAYIFLGPYLPGLLGHGGFRYIKMVDQMFVSTNAIFGTPIYVSSTVLVLYVIFGSFLTYSGGGRFFIDFANALAGHRTGGPALTAVVSSALVGTVTGNGVANVTITGSYTIPLMKKIGYRPAFAGAVEAVASQGGQIMPPIMGAAAFIMAEYTGIPYIRIAAAAAIPAVFYFLVAGVCVYLQARKRGLKGLPKETLPKLGQVLARSGYHFLPLAAIIILLVRGASPSKAGFYAVLLALGLSMIRRETRMGPKAILAALEQGAVSTVTVGVSCAAAGIIVGSVVLTGLGLRFSRLAISLAGSNLLVLLILIMICSLILGMGMPTVSCYVVLAVLAAPALTKLGVPVLAAHLFVFYFGIISGLTPPVAITAYTAAGIAGSNPFETGWIATKLALGGFIVPYLFVYNKTLLLMGTPLEVVSGILTALLGSICFACAIQGYLMVEATWWERAFLLVASLLTFHLGMLTDVVGIGLLALVIVSQSVRQKSHHRMASDIPGKARGCSDAQA